MRNKNGVFFNDDWDKRNKYRDDVTVSTKTRPICLCYSTNLPFYFDNTVFFMVPLVYLFILSVWTDEHHIQEGSIQNFVWFDKFIDPTGLPE